jgi:hypothetical protein
MKDYVLSIFSFLLGLVATFATTFYFESAKSIAYSVVELPIVVATDYSSGEKNKSKFLFNFENIAT